MQIVQGVKGEAADVALPLGAKALGAEVHALSLRQTLTCAPDAAFPQTPGKPPARALMHEARP